MPARNLAAETGPLTLPWWPDWRGECAAIVASGPSAQRMNPALLRDRVHVIAIKEGIELCPFAEVVYGCDGPWWHHRRGLPDSNAIKISYAPDACGQYRLHKVHLDPRCDSILIEQPMHIGSGGNSGFQALNLAVQFGARDILAVAFDMNDRARQGHWYGRNRWPGANNPMPSNFERWISAFENASRELKSLGVNVVVVSDDSDLKCFEKTADLAGLLERWGL